MGTQRVQTKRVLPWACRAGTRDLYHAFVALVGPVQKFSLYYTLFQFIYPNRQQAGHAVVLGRLSVSICLRAGTQIDDSKKRVDLLHYYVPSM
jgi:hypothetical protein